MTSPIDYNAVLADLEAKRGQLDAAIAVISALIGAGATEGGFAETGDGNADDNGAAPAKPPAAQRGAVRPATNTIRNDTFFGLNTRDAVKKYLGMVKRPQTPRQIATALREGGQVHAVDDKTAYTNAYTVLKRGKDTEFSQTRSGEWGLTEWYSGKSKSDSE